MKQKLVILMLLALNGLSLDLDAQTQNCTNCGVGETNPDAKLEVKGCGNTDATKSLQITNSDDKETLVVTDAGNVNINGGALSFTDGVALNLVSKYLYNIDANNPTGKYVSINTNIPFVNGGMMSSLKLSYWSYANNFDINIGWYSYGTGGASGPLRFYSPNAYITGLVNGEVSTEPVYLSNDNGKVRISVPYHFFQVFGNLTVSSDNAGLFNSEDWSKGWTIEDDQNPTIVDQTAVTVKDRTGAVTNNFFTKNQALNDNRFHDLAGYSLRLDGGSIALGCVAPASGTQVFMGSSTHDWVSIIRNFSSTKNGLKVDAMSDDPNVQVFQVKAGLNLTKSIISAKASGNVGIGTEYPGLPLDILSENLNTEARIKSHTNHVFLRMDAADSAGAFVDFYKNGGRKFTTGINENNQYQIQATDDNQVKTLAIGIDRSTGNVGIGGEPSTGGNKLTVYGPSLLNEGVYIYRDANPFVSFKNQDKLIGQIREYSKGLGFYMYDGTAWTWSGYAAENGNFGIGTTTPTRKLDVDGDAYIKDQVGIGTYFIPENQLSVASHSAHWMGYFRQGGNNGKESNGVKIDLYNDNPLSEALRVRSHDSNGWIELITANAHGKVGFGTAYPQETVHVKGTFQIETPTASTVGQVWTATSTDGEGEWADASGEIEIFDVHSSGNIFLKDEYLAIGNIAPSYPLQVTKDNPSWLAYLNNKSATGHGLYVNLESSNPSRNSLRLASKSGGVQHVDFVVTGGGVESKVGVGTYNPQEKLHVNGRVRVDMNGALGDPYVHLIPDSDEGDSWMIGIDDSGNKLSFGYGLGTLNSNTPFGTTADKMTLDVRGYLGIGTVSPSSQLHVKGTNGEIVSECTSNNRTIKINSGNSMIEASSNLNLNRLSSTHVTLALGGGNVGVGVGAPTEKLEIDGDVKVTSSGSGASIGLHSSTPTSGNYISFDAPSDQVGWFGIHSGTGNMVMNKGNLSGDLILNGPNLNGDIVLENAKKVKIKEVMNLQVLTDKPTTNNEVGDVVIIETNGAAQMWVYLSGGWSPL